MSVDIHEKTVGEIFSDSSSNKYIVPRYQREYAWGRYEIVALLTDLWEAFCLSSQRKYYLGTLVVKQILSKTEKVWEVIDGQQRLTTLTLLIPFLNKKRQNLPFSFATRKLTNSFLGDYYRGCDVEDYFNGNKEKCVPESFINAIGLIKNFHPALKNGEEHHLSMETGLLDETRNGLSFADFILQKVVMFEVVMPAETDEMDYFEVMNNRGEQLEFHEILKAKLLAKLHTLCIDDNAPATIRNKYDSLSHTFNLLWTACSKMDGHLVDHLHICYRFKENKELRWTDLTASKGQDDLDESGVPHERQSVIRDFSNFLMHVLRLYILQCAETKLKAEDIPLDERNIKKVFDDVDQKIKIDPVRFLQILVISRLNYDKYVVKAKIENDTVVEWRLKEIVKNPNGKYEVKCTFGRGNEATEDERIQKRLVYLQAALQVSNAVQRYKEWVYSILSASDEVRSDGCHLLNLLEAFVVKRIEEWIVKNQKLDTLGLQTPRLLLNVIDYLMWNASEEKRRLKIDYEFSTPRDFVFGYHNSIEHHHAQCDDTENDEWTTDQKNNIGNLYLTSSSENSSMGKHKTTEKVNIYRRAHNGNDPTNPKRHWMYVNTEWSLKQMEKLSKYVMSLIDDFHKRYSSSREKDNKDNL